MSNQLEKIKQSLLIEIEGGAHMRSVMESDINSIYIDGLNDPEVNKFMTGSREHIQTFITVKNYVKANHESATDLLLGLFISDELRGTFRLHNIDWVRSSGWIGLSIFDKSYWGHGWGKKSISTLTNIGHKTLNLKKIQASVYESNNISRRTFLSAGYSHIAEKDSDNDYDRCCLYISNQE